MTVTDIDLQKKYKLFNGENVDAIVAEFAPDAFYVQLDSTQSAQGPDQIRQVMLGWKDHFTGAHIDNFRIEEAPHLARDVDGGAQCFVVNFTGYGVYAKTFPGLEKIAPASGRSVEVPLCETVWLNAAGQFLRVENTMGIKALQ